VTDRLGPLRGPEYERVFDAARRSLERTGGVPTGQVGVSDPSGPERTALIGITGRFRPKDVKRITVALTELDALTRATASLPLAEAVVELHGKPLRFRAAEKAGVSAARDEAIGQARSSPLHETCPWYRRWLDELAPLLTKLVNQGATGRLTEAVRVLEAIDRRPADAPPYLLPALAEQTTGDTKALGRGGTTASLVLRALALRAEAPLPASAEEIRLLWDAHGVVVDDLASRVLVLNLPTRGKGLGEWLTGAAEFGTPFQVTLHQLTVHPVQPIVDQVFVCENPAILRRASQVLGPRCPTLLCTEGRPSTAFDRLARTLTAGGAVLHYHGDFDWDGIDIANGVITRHAAHPWQMTQVAYRRAVRPGAGAMPLVGRPRPTPWDPGLAETMAEVGVAVYEEAVSEMLLESLAAAADSRR
jgi:uncharacterized protein (TIGR02679 family)